MTGRITGFAADGVLTVTTELDPARQAFLHDHRIDGTPVLPGVMGMEGFAEAAGVLAPGFQVVELEDVELLAPFKFYRDEPRTLILHALLRDGGDGTLVADCELIGRRALRGQGEQETRHFTGRVRLARKRRAAPKAAVPAHNADDPPTEVGREAVYGVYFHGPAYQVLDRAWRDNGHVVGEFAGGLPADHEPAAQPTELAPRLIELCFQTAGVWELGDTGRMALPTHVDRVARFAGGKTKGRAVGGRDTARRGRRCRRRRRDRARAGAARGLPHDRAARRARAGGARPNPQRHGLGFEDRRGAATFSRLAIVNRGEPAMRLIHAVRELNEQRADSDHGDRAVHRDRARRDVRPSRRRGDLPGSEPGRRTAKAATAAATWTTARWSAR